MPARQALSVTCSFEVEESEFETEDEGGTTVEVEESEFENEDEGAEQMKYEVFSSAALLLGIQALPPPSSLTILGRFTYPPQQA